MESNQRIDFTIVLPQELVGCICSFMDSLSLCQALLVNKKLHTIGSNYIKSATKLMHNPNHIYALVIGPESSGKSSLNAIMLSTCDYWLYDDPHSLARSRGVRRQASDSCSLPGFQVTMLDLPGAKSKRRAVLRHALPCDLPLLVVNTNELTRDQEEDFSHLVLSTHHLTNASNHVIVAVNILDEISLDQQRAAYERVHQHMSTLLRDLGLNMTGVHFVPVNALNGTNIDAYLHKFSWHTGPSLIDLFIKVHREARTDPAAYGKLCNARTKFQVYQQVFIPGIGGVFCGRLLSGTMGIGYLSMVQPGEVMTMRHSAIESDHCIVYEAKPGHVVGCEISPNSRYLCYEFRGYMETARDSNTFPSLHKTIAFRAELSIHVPLEFGPNRHFNLYYCGVRFTCFVLHVFEDENQSRKIILPNMEGESKIRLPNKKRQEKLSRVPNEHYSTRQQHSSSCVKSFL